MAKDKKNISIKELKLSQATTDNLNLSGIDFLDDLNTFTLKELK